MKLWMQMSVWQQTEAKLDSPKANVIYQKGIVTKPLPTIQVRVPYVQVKPKH